MACIKKPEILVLVSETFHKIFNLVEDEVIRLLKVPADVRNNQSNENAFQRLLMISMPMQNGIVTQYF